MSKVKAAQRSGPTIASDQIRLDTSSAPWMDIAKAELGKKIHELTANDPFIKSLRGALALDAQMRASEKTLAEFGQGSMLLGTQPDAWDPGRFNLFSRQLVDPTGPLVGRMEADRLKERNPEIDKYFDGLKSDPSYDKKGRSYDIDSTHQSGGYGRITAWCAAFVNWCLSEVDVPHLGYATARSWLDFGTPVAYPVYGCLTIIKPSTSTGSTTGHVAFFVKMQGKRVVLLGGNQGDAVSEVPFNEASVLGYRWPTRIDHYLLAQSQGVLV